MKKKIVNKINSNIAVETTGSFYQYAKKCDVLICIDMSTAILEAMLLKKPVIMVLLNDKSSYPEIFQNDYLFYLICLASLLLILPLIYTNKFNILLLFLIYLNNMYFKCFVLKLFIIPLTN